MFENFRKFPTLALINTNFGVKGREFSKNVEKKMIFVFSQYFFHFEKTIFLKIFFTTPTRNLLRNPKIILRKPCDEFKVTKKSKCSFFCKIFHILFSRYVHRPLKIYFKVQQICWASSVCDFSTLRTS